MDETTTRLTEWTPAHGAGSEDEEHTPAQLDDADGFIRCFADRRKGETVACVNMAAPWTVEELDEYDGEERREMERFPDGEWGWATWPAVEWIVELLHRNPGITDSGFATKESAMAACDEVLAAKGYVLG